MAEFCSSRTAGALATALLGDRANRCTNLDLSFPAGGIPSLTATFYLSEEEALALGSALQTETWALVDQEAVED
jgi:hypothetical protein